ncbi:hypothetical protein [Stenotrophomonas sp.]|uniref:hypothetical protein n=1 Tax=Stenotrophomonas sp. TaxID=69392 RepID=UPI0028983A7B|nr:hypothetical protein [Stenotrophomonas sp.]
MSRGALTIGVDAALENCAFYLLEEQGLTQAATQIAAVQKAVTELRSAAHASLTARDLADQMAADARLRAALAACEPTDPHNEREAVEGLCVEENDHEQ